MNKRYYIVCKENNEVVYGYIDYENIHGFDIKPQNNVPYSGIEVGHLTLVEPELIKRVLKRKILSFLAQKLGFKSDNQRLLLEPRQSVKKKMPRAQGIKEAFAYSLLTGWRKQEP